MIGILSEFSVIFCFPHLLSASMKPTIFLEKFFLPFSASEERVSQSPIEDVIIEQKIYEYGERLSTEVETLKSQTNPEGPSTIRQVRRNDVLQT